MVNTECVTGFYTDVFGNEVDEYEQIERYSVCYNGPIFHGDGDGYNEFGTDRLEDAMAIYHAYPDRVSIRDNEYGLRFADGEWY